MKPAENSVPAILGNPEQFSILRLMYKQQHNTTT